jgi:hypothetical protein
VKNTYFDRIDTHFDRIDTRIAGKLRFFYPPLHYTVPFKKGGAKETVEKL